jgi:NAD(P)-dependent dehydrogenase (short-subunit alcohol dehydrogenase family)
MAPTFDLKDKVIVITGGSGGIGLATAHLLLSEGAKISIADVSSAALAEAKKELLAAYPNARLIAEVVDVRKAEQVNAWIAKTVQEFGKLDGACNLAGYVFSYS